MSGYNKHNCSLTTVGASVRARTEPYIKISQQYESQQNSSNKVLYAHGSWLKLFQFTILATHISSDEDLICLEVRRCPAALLLQVQADYLAYTFSSLLDDYVPIGGNHLLKGVAELAADTLQNFRGWLGHFSSEQNEFIRRIFEEHDSDPWGRVIDPQWKAIIRHIDE